MIKKIQPYIDLNGIEHIDLVLIYSDLGVSLFQVDTGLKYSDKVIDHISTYHVYREMVEELGELPEELKEEPEEEVEQEGHKA